VVAFYASPLCGYSKADTKVLFMVHVGDELPAQGRHEGAADGKPEAEAAACVAGCVFAPEWLEEVSDICVGKPGGMVADDDGGFACVAGADAPDWPVGADITMPKGVVDQVADD